MEGLAVIDNPNDFCQVAIIRNRNLFLTFSRHKQHDTAAENVELVISDCMKQQDIKIYGIENIIRLKEILNKLDLSNDTEKK